MSRIRTVAAGTALALLTSVARAQPAPPASVAQASLGPQKTPSAADAITSARTLLASLVPAQEKYWYNHGRYSADLAALGVSTGKSGQPKARLLAAGGSGWTALAEHPSLRGKTCVVFVGNGPELAAASRTMDPKLKVASEGTPACDQP
ncbi:MAG TPA: hypothetical protein VHE78_13655 [Gemmatimonadaceae bacterium]|nr:hypothetical protein [Gemmatimonadaceae bacterium]